MPLLFEHAQLLWQLGAAERASKDIETLLKQTPEHHVAWMLLGQIREACGDGFGAMRAYHQALTRAHKVGEWKSEQTTHPALLNAVMRNGEKLYLWRREYLFGVLQRLEDELGAATIARIGKALKGYLGDLDATPPDPRQRPKFFFVPDLPVGPYHDPLLQSWAPTLREAWQDMRAEAIALLAEDRDFQSFLDLKPGQSKESYIGGTNPKAAWDAFFFYRHGRRFDENHARCPTTSAVLEDLKLCRIEHQAPEICFSVIRSRSIIMPHYGVTNSRLVMHLPLIVPPDCALDIVGGEPHYWKEGELMMFDDTYQHGAWNHSDEARLILLMDCWNPHLSDAEQQAVKQIVEAIDALENRSDLNS